MTRNYNLYQAALHLYAAAKHLSEIDLDTKNGLLDLAKDYLSRVEITDEVTKDQEEIDKYAEEIRGSE